MGGCKCSYRRCSVRTDGKTHMFHFPVYDKVRCHQWILNAQRYEFFNLTVSQVRNRVVCQHHFTDECFMNYKKEKLTFEAVPTENGPYCDSNNDEIKSEVVEAYSFIENIIENESLYIDKKANSSLKYVDFLTNIDVSPVKTDLWKRENIFLVPPRKLLKDESVSDKQIKTIQSLIKKNKTTANIQHVDVEPNDNEKEAHNVGTSIEQNKFVDNIEYPERTNTNSVLNRTLFQVQPVLISPFHVQSTNLNSTNSEIINTTGQTNQENSKHLTSNQAQNATVIKNEGTQKVSKIKIISEQTVTEPMPFIGNLEPVSPTLVLKIPNRKKVKKPIGISHSKKLQSSSKPQVCYIEIMPNEEPEMQSKSELVSNEISAPIARSKPQKLQSSPKPEVCYIEIMPNEEPELQTKSEKVRNDITQITSAVGNEDVKCEIEMDAKLSVPNSHNFKLQDSKTLDDCKTQAGKLPVLKSKIAPERVAAIERKRNFNKKLRDIVETYLKNPDKNHTSILKVKDTENVSCNKQSQIPKETRSPATKGDKTMADLEARLEKMENILAKKIEQNSVKISELRKSYKEKKSTHSVYTQTLCNEESYKKYLFNEISQYLSPGSRSIIYEELFINKFVQKESECEPKLKRRRRR